jgi:hypothetical protein
MESFLFYFPFDQGISQYLVPRFGNKLKFRKRMSKMSVNIASSSVYERAILPSHLSALVNVRGYSCDGL